MVYCRAVFIASIVFLTGCASHSLQRARSEFYSGDPVRADHILGECKRISEKDQLLCFMEKGVVLHDLQAYKESADVLLKASQLIKDQDIVNISDQASAVTINDKVMTYKGEYCERLWVHTFLMMNFLLQYKYENALVEAKQALEVYDEHPDSLEKDYFTRALIALCYENMNKPDDAKIEYKKLEEVMNRDFSTPEPIPQDKGELVLFVAQGHIPEKISIEIAVPRSTRISIPRYADSCSPPPVSIRSDCGLNTRLKIITDLGDVARKSLNDRATQYLARLAIRAGVKESIAQKAEKKSKLAEIVVRTVLFHLEEADTRAWETLPGSLTLARIALDPGTHNLEISSKYSGPVYLNGIDISEGKRVYRSIRF